MATIKGGDRLEATLRELSRKVRSAATLRVGFLENATYPDGTSVAEVAMIQNYGAPARGIPPRPFFSNMIADNAGSWAEAIKACLLSANLDAKTALSLFGTQVVGELQEAIISISEPALSPVTLLLRERFPTRDGMTFEDVLQAFRDVGAGVEPSGAHANPLVWSGFMLQSVDMEVA